MGHGGETQLQVVLNLNSIVKHFNALFKFSDNQ